MFLFSLFWAYQVVIGCDGVNSMVSNMVALHPTKLLRFSTCVARGFTKYQNDHQFPSEFVMISRGQVQLGRIPITDKLVYWFVTRLSTSQDSIISKDPVLIRRSVLESIEDFPVHAMDMIQNCKLSSLHLTDLKYRPPWDLLLNRFNKGTIVVAGDAMHVTGPFVAQGGSASIEDAIVLARCLAEKMDNTTDAIAERNDIEEAFDKYAKERRMRIFWLSLNTFLVGKRLDTKSCIVRSIVFAMMVVLFRDPDGHSRYNCGTL